ncbi:hypothetical protein D9619_013040 [Psilocybe cf. subviscida]|uniref:C2H2-type domain-containing protein n=1 Tax=Psilocybe cf. subviscida TaxID=2480587 RepID=A0A8H5B088_9AGAR|nr:hypothetical protein D9619_013040 [Psilocybe cf. subviscida]
MTFLATDAANGSPVMEGVERSRALSFPESFQRSGPRENHNGRLAAKSPPFSPEMQSSSSSSAQTTPGLETDSSGSYEGLSTGTFSRSRDVMRLENILNDVSISQRSASHSHERSRSVGFSTPEDEWSSETGPSSYSMGQSTRSESPDTTKKKKVKLHRCPQCNKDFPRPSGLRTHMNTHTREKPYPCTFPGCDRTFSVVSNAKRHMRTHGLGVSTDDVADITRVPYIVGFEPPIVAPVIPEIEDTPKRKDPVRLRWPSIQDQRSNQTASPASSLSAASSVSDTNSRRNSNTSS